LICKYHSKVTREKEQRGWRNIITAETFYRLLYAHSRAYTVQRIPAIPDKGCIDRSVESLSTKETGNVIRRERGEGDAFSAGWKYIHDRAGVIGGVRCTSLEMDCG
jgi:hypothetical protein